MRAFWERKRVGNLTKSILIETLAGAELSVDLRCSNEPVLPAHKAYLYSCNHKLDSQGQNSRFGAPANSLHIQWNAFRFYPRIRTGNIIAAYTMEKSPPALPQHCHGVFLGSAGVSELLRDHYPGWIWGSAQPAGRCKSLRCQGIHPGIRSRSVPYASAQTDILSSAETDLPRRHADTAHKAIVMGNA